MMALTTLPAVSTGTMAVSVAPEPNPHEEQTDTAMNRGLRLDPMMIAKAGLFPKINAREAVTLETAHLYQETSEGNGQWSEKAKDLTQR